MSETHETRNTPPDAGKKRILHNTLWLTAAFLGGRLISYVGFIIIARTFTEREVGVWAILLTASLFCEILSSLGLDKLMVREVVRSARDEAPQLLSSILLIKLGISFVVGALAYAGIMLAYPEVAAQYAASTAIFLCSVPCIAVTRSLEAWHTALEKMHIPAIAQVVERCALFTLTFFAWQAGAGFGFFIACSALAPVARFFIALWGVRPYLRAPQPRKYGGLLREALALFAVDAVAGLYQRVDILLLSFLGSLEAAGLYNVAYRMFEFATIAFAGYITAIFPSLIRKMTASHLKSSFLLGLALTVAVAAGGILLRQFLLSLFGPVYLAADSALLILMLVLPFCYATSFMTYYLVATGEVRLLLKISAMVVLSNVLLNVLLIPHFSIVGSAMAFLLAEVLSLGVLGWAIAPGLRRSWAEEEAC